MNGEVTIADNKAFTVGSSNGGGATTLWGSFDASGSTDTFKTSQGANTIGGDTTMASNKNFAMTGTGTFGTGAGAVSLNGEVTIADNKAFTVGSSGTNAGATTIYGTVAVTSTLSAAGAATFSSNIVQTGTGTFGTGTTWIPCSA